MKCLKCGAEFEGKFCPECGTPIEAQASESVNQPVQPQIPQQTPYQNPVVKQKKKGGFLKGALITIGVIFVISIIANMSNGSKGNNSAAPAAASPTQSKAEQVSSQDADKTTSYDVGKPATSNGITMTLASVKESKGSEYFKPADGKVFLMCEFNIENNSSNDLSISSVMCFEAYVDGYSVDQSITGLSAKGSKQQLDGKVAAGKKMNGVIAYEVPKNWKELEIQVNPDVLSMFSGKTVFKAANK